MSGNSLGTKKQNLFVPAPNSGHSERELHICSTGHSWLTLFKLIHIRRKFALVIIIYVVQKLPHNKRKLKLLSLF